jgi:hypothetical protein
VDGRPERDVLLRVGRVTSKVSGSANCAGSRLAAGRIAQTSESAGIVTPPTTTSSVVRRKNCRKGESQRRTSSTAFGMSVGSARTASQACGKRAKAWTALARRLLDESTEVGPALRVAAEILYDVYLGALWRWIRDDSPAPGAFLAELDSVVELVIQGLAASSTTVS